MSSPIIRGRELVQRQKLPSDENYQENLNKLRKTTVKAKRLRVAPIDRGWSGGSARGRKAGPPDPVGDCENHFELPSKDFFCQINFQNMRPLVRRTKNWHFRPTSSSHVSS